MYGGPVPVKNDFNLSLSGPVSRRGSDIYAKPCLSCSHAEFIIISISRFAGDIKDRVAVICPAVIICGVQFYIAIGLKFEAADHGRFRFLFAGLFLRLFLLLLLLLKKPFQVIKLFFQFLYPYLEVVRSGEIG